MTTYLTACTAKQRFLHTGASQTTIDNFRPAFVSLSQALLVFDSKLGVNNGRLEQQHHKTTCHEQLVRVAV